MPDTINGLPAHVLLIHLVVAVVPLAALMTVLSAAWPAARRRLGVATPLVALLGLVLVPITTNAGEWLEHRLPESAAIEKHAELGDGLLPWAIGLFVVAAAVHLLGRRTELAWRSSTPPAPADVDAPSSGGTALATRPATRVTPARTLPTWVTAVVTVVALVVAVGTVVQLYRIGDSGASAAWDFVQKLPAR